MGSRAPFSETTRRSLWASAQSSTNTPPWSSAAMEAVSPVASATRRTGSDAASRIFHPRLTTHPYSNSRTPSR